MTTATIRPRRAPDGRHTGEKVRRHSQLAGRCEGRIWAPFDRRDVPRFLRAAERYERVTRPKGSRVGKLGPVGLEVFRELLRRVEFKNGRCDPSYAWLMERLNRSKDAIARALKALRAAGFVDWIRRYVHTGETGFGVQVKQTSNAYRLMLPPAAERLLDATGGRPAPVADDLASETAKRAQQIRDYANQETPLFARFERAERERRERESAGRSQSAIMDLLEVAESEKEAQLSGVRLAPDNIDCEERG